MKISAIYVACYKHDVRFTRILVANIRSLYPDIPLFLVKDRMYGDFATEDIESNWNVQVLPLTRSRFGWGFSKLEPLFLPERQRCLILDSDVLLTAGIIERLESCEADFVVSREEPTAEFIQSHYLDLDKLRAFDPNFQFPGYTFNTGQFVATTGMLQRADFEPMVEWSNPPRIVRPDTFKLGEQGLLNYVLAKKHQQGAIALSAFRFMEVPQGADEVEGKYGEPLCRRLSLSEVLTRTAPPLVVHWCGLKRPRISEMYCSQLLLHFEGVFYSKMRLGWIRRRWRTLCTIGTSALKTLFRRYVLRRGIA